MILRKMVGILLVVAALAGIIFSLAGLDGIWRYRPMLTKTVTNNLALVDQALGTTQDVLNIVGQVVQTSTGEVVSLQATTRSLAQTIQDTQPMLDSLVSLTSKDFPAAVNATQTSLASAQSSALLIDNVMASLSSLPFLSLNAYQPEVPLHTALGQVSTSLDALKPALDTIHTSLAEGRTNLGIMQVELTKITSATQGINSSLAGAQGVIDQYKAQTTQLKARVENAQIHAPGWIRAGTWILSFIFVWLLIAQLGLASQGLEMLRGRVVAQPISDSLSSSQP
jgi:hypothetical protein